MNYRIYSENNDKANEMHEVYKKQNLLYILIVPLLILIKLQFLLQRNKYSWEIIFQIILCVRVDPEDISRETYLIQK